MNGPRIPTLPPNIDTAHRRRLTDQIFRLLKTNSTFARGVYDGFDASQLPKGGMRQIYKQRPFDGIRCEIGGKTLTVEITSLRKGEQDEADALRFATYDYDHFYCWFFSLLSRSRQLPRPPADQGLPTNLLRVKKTTGTVRPDLRSAPSFHRRSQKGGRR